MAEAKARMPSSAIKSITGLLSCAYKPSAACAIAFMALVTDKPTGNDKDKFAS